MQWRWWAWTAVTLSRDARQGQGLSSNRQPMPGNTVHNSNPAVQVRTRFSPGRHRNRRRWAGRRQRRRRAGAATAMQVRAHALTAIGSLVQKRGMLHAWHRCAIQLRRGQQGRSAAWHAGHQRNKQLPCSVRQHTEPTWAVAARAKVEAGWGCIKTRACNLLNGVCRHTDSCSGAQHSSSTAQPAHTWVAAARAMEVAGWGCMQHKGKVGVGSQHGC